MRKKWSLRGLALVLGCLPASAWGGDLLIRVACPDWPAETASQVEARIRATLLAESLTAHRVNISCDPDGPASVSVESEHGTLVRPVARSSSRIEDDVVEAVEMALRELVPASPEQPSPGPALTPEPVPAPAPAPARASLPAAAPAKDPPPPALPAAPRASSVTEISIGPLSERWSDYWASGAEVGMSVGDDRFRYGLTFGGAAAVGEPGTFDISDWRANARLAFAFPKAAGLRTTLGVGASLLVTTPGESVIAESGTLLGAASLELHLARPFLFGSFGIAPVVGVRLFSGRRNVRVNDREELAMPLVVPQAGLWLIYRGK